MLPVTFDLLGINIQNRDALCVIAGVALALLIGKPLGVLCATWTSVKVGAYRLPPGVS